MTEAWFERVPELPLFETVMEVLFTEIPALPTFDTLPNFMEAFR